jgi:hypothetical protein
MNVAAYDRLLRCEKERCGRVVEAKDLAAEFE